MLLFKRYTFVSKLLPDILIGRLQEQLVKKPGFFQSAIGRYWGRVDDHSFKIIKGATSKSNRSITIKGDILDTDTGSTVKLAMRLPLISWLVLSFILAGCIFLSVIAYSPKDKIFLFSFLFPLVVYIGSLLIFKSEVKTAKEFLLNLFEATEVQ